MFHHFIPRTLIIQAPGPFPFSLRTWPGVSIPCPFHAVGVPPVASFEFLFLFLNFFWWGRVTQWLLDLIFIYLRFVLIWLFSTVLLICMFKLLLFCLFLGYPIRTGHPDRKYLGI
ncbi:hypothetical protein BDV28DRAFT_25183 [Aspergillus coremiiformis]|uniref:Uncharacterized protein n=1 Tax=Aspergillus coremiiformis TaxID=138285 RepID=A0A5N6Z201_9EURO|nr:hypothetical protein BDV28DRAFT_25183 [Aspergillus coremiiformis]